jgi:hypothetical protein
LRRWGADGSQDVERYDLDFDSVFALSDELAETNRRRCHRLVDAFLDEFADSPSQVDGALERQR